MNKIDETRKYERIDYHKTIDLKIGKKLIECKIKNISLGGALLIVNDDKIKLPEDIDNQEAYFEINTTIPSKVTFRGIVLRQKEEDGQQCIAIKFFQEE